MCVRPDWMEALKMLQRSAILAVTWVVVGTGGVGTQQPDLRERAADQIERFELFTDCAPMELLVEPDQGRPDFTAAVTALLDRLLHHAHVLKCGPRSWRTKVQTTLRTHDPMR